MRPCLMSQKIFLLTSKSNCINFSLELKFFILSHPVDSKQPRKMVQRLKYETPSTFFSWSGVPGMASEMKRLLVKSVILLQCPFYLET